MGTLALIMFVAFALQNTSHGKDAETRGPASVGIPTGEVIIDKSHDGASNIASRSTGQTIPAPLTLWQFMSMIVNAFERAFNDPQLIEYGKQQGIGIPDSPTTSLLNASSQPPAPSKSPSSYSSRSSSSY
jgi:hypothetical protein